jgi:hypothetical protein
MRMNDINGGTALNAMLRSDDAHVCARNQLRYLTVFIAGEQKYTRESAQVKQ